MSTILKALRRLEEEKASAEEPRPLREQIASERQIERPARRGWLAAIVALVLGVGAGGGAIWWMFRGESGGAAPPVVAQATPQPVSAPVAVAAPPLAPPVEPVPADEPDRGPPEQAFESDVEIIPRPDVGPRLADDTPVEPAMRAAQAGSHRPVESSAAAERARQAAIAEAEAAAAARENQPVAAEPPPPVVPHVAEVPTPLPPPPAEPPVEVRLPAPPPPAAAARKAPTPAVAKAKPASPPPAPRPGAVEKAAPPPPINLPQLEVEKTQWHPLPERRIAWLHVSGESDSRKVKEGDVVDGLVVAKIEPSGVVFERGGEQFHRGVGKR